MAAPKNDGATTRPSTAKPARKRARVSRTEVCPTTPIDLIDAAFNRVITITENGAGVRLSVFEAIHRQLWRLEMGGDPQALEVRLQYEAFARDQRPKRDTTIIVIGGLPKKHD